MSVMVPDTSRAWSVGSLFQKYHSFHISCFYFDAKVAWNGHNVRNNSTEDCDGFTDSEAVKQEKGMPIVSFYFRQHIRNCFWVYRICRGNAKQVVLGLEHLHLP